MASFIFTLLSFLLSLVLLNQNIMYLKGVGPQRAEKLKKYFEIETVRDLLYNFPYRYVDRTKFYTINELTEGMDYIQLRGRITDFDAPEGEGRKRRIKAYFTDGTGYLQLVWFNGLKYVTENYTIGKEIVIFGKPSFFNGQISIIHPEIETLSPTTATRPQLVPRYHMSDKAGNLITQRNLAEWVTNALQLLRGKITDPLPASICMRHKFMPLEEALYKIHFPQNSEEIAAARARMKYEELFFLQLEILRYAQIKKEERGFYLPRVGEKFNTFYTNYLPFPLTEAQKRVIKEIRNDFITGKQMNRLVQGDVGSGKTLVAFLSCLIAIDNGFQSCLMAPTEILAEQHFQTLSQLASGLNINVCLLTGSVKGKKRKLIEESLAEGTVHLLVGTHALIEPNVNFKNLGLCVIDEQHRFGVKQRAQLWEKNTLPPHVLVMTATPIPRTLAMTLYGDLDVSIIDELPPGRKPIQTFHYYYKDLQRVFSGIRSELNVGRQIYVVYPLIKENERMDLLDLERGYELLTQELPNYQVGKLHGKMKPAEKDEVMKRFSEGKTHVLVATTVIEVGVNVPNASVMVIHHADRFGLAQLHQLRGRVGRGAEKSYCILLTNYELSEHTRRRMQIMVETTDGFIIAEEDLKMRGPGDLEGTAQSGLPFNLKVANLTKDADTMQTARDDANNLLNIDPNLTDPNHQLAVQHLKSLKKQFTNYANIS